MKLRGTERQQQVSDLPQQVLEGSEELGEVGVVPVHVERTVGEDEEATDDRQTRNCKHQTEKLQLIKY